MNLTTDECDLICAQVDDAIKPATRYDYMRGAAKFANAALQQALSAAQREAAKVCPLTPEGWLYEAPVTGGTWLTHFSCEEPTGKRNKRRAYSAGAAGLQITPTEAD